MKVCSKCGKYKLIDTEFAVEKHRNNRPTAACYKCNRLRNTRWRREHRKEYLRSKAKYRQTHKEQIKAARKMWAL